MPSVTASAPVRVTEIECPRRQGGIAVALLLGGIVLIGLGLRLWQIGSASFWTDEFFSVEVASGRGFEHLDVPSGKLTAARDLTDLDTADGWETLGRSLSRSTHPPLYFLLLRLWCLVFGDSDAAARAMSAVWSALGILLIYDVVRLLHGRHLALWAALVMALAGPQIEFAQEARGYSLLIALMLLACGALVRLEQQPDAAPRRGQLLLLGGATLGMLLTHYLAAGLWLALAAYALLRLGARRRAALVAMTLAGLLFAAMWLPVFLRQADNAPRSLGWIVTHDPDHVTATFRQLVELPTRLFFNPMRKEGRIIWLAAAILVIPLAMLRRRPDLLLWCLILGGSVGVLLASDLVLNARTLVHHRYAMPASVAVYALGVALCAHFQGWRRHALPAVLALSCLLALPEAYVRWKPDWRALARYIDQQAAPGEPIAFYHAGSARWASNVLYLGLARYARTFPRPILILDEPADAAVMTELLARGQRVWLISGCGSVDSDALLPGMKAVDQTYFPNVAVCTQLRPQIHPATEGMAWYDVILAEEVTDPLLTPPSQMLVPPWRTPPGAW